MVGRPMHGDSNLSVVQSSLLAFLIAAAILSLSGCRPAASDRPEAAVEGASEAQTGTAKPPAAGGAGMQVHIDPETGEFLDEPPPGADLGGDVPALPGDAVERPAPGGGVMIELQPKPPTTTN